MDRTDSDALVIFGATGDLAYKKLYPALHALQKRGKLDIPEQYGIGAAWQATPRLTLAADWLRILWGELKVMQDPNGFRWRNQPVFRFGASWALDDRFTLRAGFSRNHGQIDSARAVQNLLVPAVHEKAWSAGLSWALDARSELSAGYELNPRSTLAGTGPSSERVWLLDRLDACPVRPDPLAAEPVVSTYSLTRRRSIRNDVADSLFRYAGSTCPAATP